MEINLDLLILISFNITYIKFDIHLISHIKLRKHRITLRIQYKTTWDSVGLYFYYIWNVEYTHIVFPSRAAIGAAATSTNVDGATVSATKIVSPAVVVATVSTTSMPLQDTYKNKIIPNIQYKYSKYIANIYCNWVVLHFDQMYLNLM